MEQFILARREVYAASVVAETVGTGARGQGGNKAAGAKLEA